MYLVLFVATQVSLRIHVCGGCFVKSSRMLISFSLDDFREQIKVFFLRDGNKLLLCLALLPARE